VRSVCLFYPQTGEAGDWPFLGVRGNKTNQARIDAQEIGAGAPPNLVEEGGDLDVLGGGTAGSGLKGAERIRILRLSLKRRRERGRATGNQKKVQRLSQKG